jgi:hypothetical protein
MDYKKIRTDIINGKKRCIYMKPKGKREYVKSGGEFVSLSVYIKTLQKKMKIKGGAGYIDERGRHIDRDTFLAKVGRRLTDLKAKGTSLTRGLMGKGLDELVPAANNHSNRVPSDFRSYHQRLFADSKFIDTEHRQEARENAYEFGSNIRKAVLGNRGERAPQQFGVAEVLRYDAAGRRAPVVRSGVTAELVFSDSYQERPTANSTYPPGRPTAPSTYSDDDIGFA